MDLSRIRIAFRPVPMHRARGLVLGFASRSAAITLATALLMFPTIAAFAATDGALGNTSVATTDVSLIVGETAQASGLSDIILTPWSDGDSAPFGTTHACVYSSTGGYQVTAISSNGTGTNFRLASGAAFIPYALRWNDGTTGLTPVANGTPLTGRVGDSSSPTCSGSTPVTIEVRIATADIATAGFGSYADILTVMITPQ